MNFLKKHFASLLPFFVSVIAIWLIASFVSQLLIYLRYTHQAPAKIKQWNIIEIDDEHYQISADYAFELDHVEYTSEQFFTKKTYPNRESAEFAIENLKENTYTAWWYGSPRHFLSTIDRSFPLAACLRALIATSITLYFLYLSRRLTESLA